MHFTRRAFLASTAALAARPSFAGETTSLGGDAFGSYWRLTLPRGGDARPAETAIRRVVARIDALMSPYRADSELSRFNRAEDGIAASAETLSVARDALDTAAETGGAFDPTVGPLVARYGFGPIHDAAPGSHEGIRLRGDTLAKDSPDLSLDFCGIAKGYALDLMRAGLDGLGLAGYLLELGGEVAARGRHPTGRAWRVALDGAPLALALPGGAVATSGLLAQSYSVGGHRYGHIIDPATAAPATGALVSVSVLDPKATRADALATALFAMGLDRGGAFAQAAGLDTILLARDGDALRPFFTGRAADHLLG